MHGLTRPGCKGEGEGEAHRVIRAPQGLESLGVGVGGGVYRLFGELGVREGLDEIILALDEAVHERVALWQIELLCERQPWCLTYCHLYHHLGRGNQSVHQL